MGFNRRKYRSKIKKGGLLVPTLLTGIGAAGTLLGGATTAYKNWKVVQNNKKILDEIKRQNNNIQTLMTGKGYYLRPYKKKGKGLRRKRSRK